jgi:hypothetical protein
MEETFICQNHIRKNELKEKEQDKRKEEVDVLTSLYHMP